MTVPVTELSTLAASHDIVSIGMRADDVRRARHGTRVTFVRVADVSSDAGAPVVVPPGAGELRIVGVPCSVSAALSRVADVKAVARGLPVSGYSLADLEHLAGVERVTLRGLLEDLHAAGLELVAEAPLDRLGDPRRSIEEVNISGLALGRLTVDQWPAVEPQVVLQQVAALQRQVGVIRAFAPLPRKTNPAAPTTGYDDIKKVALARLFVENVKSIQVDWSLYGPKLAQVALTVGADDLDGVSPSDEAPDGPRRSPLEEVRRNVKAAGLDPVERDGRFEIRSR